MQLNRIQPIHRPQPIIRVPVKGDPFEHKGSVRT